MNAQRYVVLDLDKTMIFAEAHNVLEECIPGENYFFIRPIARKQLFKVTRRKYLDKFLDFLDSKDYKIVIWSAGGSSYVKDIISVIFKNRKFEYLLTYEHLVDDFKDLKIIKEYIPGFEIENSRLIDDNSNHSIGQEKYFIKIKPFELEDDDELIKILDILEFSW